MKRAPKCALREMAVAAVERELGVPAQRWSHVMAAVDPRYANLLLVAESTLLVVEDRVIDASHLELVSEPADHIGLGGRKIIYAHQWAEDASSGSAREECKDVEIVRIDDGTCAHPPVRDSDWSQIAKRRGVLGCSSVMAIFLTVPFAAYRLWSVSPLISVPALIVLFGLAPLAWTRLRRARPAARS